MKEKKKVMCFGTFDNFHPGHLYYLEESKKYGDYLIVVIARDENVLRIKKKLPRQNEEERFQGVKKINCVDKVVMGELEDRFAVINKYKPDVLSFGYDQIFDSKKIKEIFLGEMIKQKSFKPSIYKSSKINNDKNRKK